MQGLRERIQALKKRRPGYEKILDFYLKVREKQEKIQKILKIDPIPLRSEWKALLAKEGLPLLERRDFPLDFEACATLFHELCQIAKPTNPHLSQQVQKIEQHLNKEPSDLRRLFQDGLEERRIEGFAEELAIDPKVLLFLVRASIQPSVDLTRERLLCEVDRELWQKTICPLCGSLPYLALLKEETGKRYLLCSFCGSEWRIDRLLCPFCGNGDQTSLHYFTAEGEEMRRVNLCDQCHQYIKTILLGESAGFDPCLEDLASFHLDLVASQKGYRRPVPQLWI